MKNLIILFIILISLASCGTKPQTIITKEQFIENINSFDSTAIYINAIPEGSHYSFVIKCHDSLFVYDVEDCNVIHDIYIKEINGGCVK